MRDIRCELLTCLILIAAQASLHAQSPGTAPVSATSIFRCGRTFRRVGAEIGSDLIGSYRNSSATRSVATRDGTTARGTCADQETSCRGSTRSSASHQLSKLCGCGEATAAAIEDLQEQQQTTEAQVKVHDQTKVESSSKYPLRVTGLVLFNSFVNRGSVDNIDLPEAALNNQSNTTGNGSAGATFRQTILGLQGYGPKIAGARTSAECRSGFLRWPCL